MDESETEVCAGKSRRIQKRAARGSDGAKPRRRSFTEARRLIFLNHFAASCNAAAAARAAGIAENTVYSWRRKDEQFRNAWNEALDQGYARLEAELVRSAARALQVRANAGAAARVGALDPKTALAVLEAYRRSGGRVPGEVWPHPYDIAAVRARLERKMKALGILDGRGVPNVAEAGEPEEIPPPPAATASPRNRGEEG